MKNEKYSHGGYHYHKDRGEFGLLNMQRDQQVAQRQALFRATIEAKWQLDIAHPDMIIGKAYIENAEATRKTNEAEYVVKMATAPQEAIDFIALRTQYQAECLQCHREIRTICNDCEAEKVKLKTCKYQHFRDVDSAEFSDSEIVGTCFYQREPFTKVFPDGVKNLVLQGCNCDNVDLSNISNLTLIKTTNRQYRTANDGEYWIVNEQNEFVEPREKEKYLERGLSIDPHNLPDNMTAEPILTTTDPQRIKQEKINILANDPARLEELLREKGEL